MNAILAFLEKFCDSGQIIAIINAGEIAKNLDIDNTFAETRYRRKKRLFNYEDDDENSHVYGQIKFKISFFQQLVDCSFEP